MSNWTRGLGVPGLYEAAKIAKLFGVDLDYLADDSLDEPPAADLTEGERALVSLVRVKGLTLEEAIRRLETVPVVPPLPTGDQPRYGRVLAEQDLTESSWRRYQEANEAKRAEKPERKPPQGPRESRGRGGKGQSGKR